MKRIKAIAWIAYGPHCVLEIRKVQKPSAKDNEVLIRIRATTVTTWDANLRQLPSLFRLPTRLLGPVRKKVPAIERIQLSERAR